MERNQYELGDRVKFINYVDEIIRIDKATITDDVILVKTKENEIIAIFTWMIDQIIKKEA